MRFTIIFNMYSLRRANKGKSLMLFKKRYQNKTAQESLNKANRIRNIFMAICDSKCEVKKKICSVFDVKDSTVLEAKC